MFWQRSAVKLAFQRHFFSASVGKLLSKISRASTNSTPAITTFRQQANLLSHIGQAGANAGAAVECFDTYFCPQGFRQLRNTTT